MAAERSYDEGPGGPGPDGAAPERGHEPGGLSVVEIAFGAGQAPPPPGRLLAHWRTWVGDWAADGRELTFDTALTDPPTVLAHPRTVLPGWDGRLHPVRGIVDPDGRALLGVPPDVAARLGGSGLAGCPLDRLMAELPALLERPEGRIYRAVYRWSTDPAPLPDAGVWLAHDDPRVPEWLHPFGGEVLVALDGERYLGGVGIKRHDAAGRELAVVTSEAARGQGLARRLVAQAARRVLDEGAVPTYMHSPTNTASARVADAAGFPDHGWTALGLADR